MAKLVHYGKILNSNITDMGIPKKKIYDLLNMNSRTLELRLADAKFSFDELRALRDKKYI